MIKKITARILMVLVFLTASLAASAQTRITVTGVVTDDTNQPVIGASVMAKGLTVGVPTDLDGKYSIEVADNAILVFSSVGMKTVEMPVGGRTVINVSLPTDQNFLDQAVVVGYGTQKKGSLTGAVAAVSDDDIIKTKSENPQNMLTGRVTGLRVWQKSAEPGSYSNNFDIRGFGTPLVIIDGVPRDVADFQRLNPADIENVSVLKDASAAIYGVRGGNGVVLVTTKKGSQGKTTVTYNGSFTFQKPSGLPTLTNAVDAMTLYNEKNMNSLHSGSLIYTDEYIDSYRNGTRKATDWNNLVIADWVPQTQHDLSIQGGTEKIQYYVSMGYIYQEGFFKSGDLNYDKYNLRSNITAELAKGLKLDVNIAAMLDEQNNPYTSSVYIIRNWWSQGVLSPAYVDDAQTMLNHNGLDLMNNTIALMTSDISGYRKYNKKTFQSSATLSYDFGSSVDVLKGLSAKAMFSYDYRNDQNETFSKEYSLYAVDEISGEYVATTYPSHPNNLSKANYNRTQLLGQFTLNYDRTFAEKHNVGALVGWEVQKKNGDNYTAAGDLATGTPYFTSLNGQNQLISTSNGISDMYDLSYESLIGRLNYNYDERYIAEFQFRYDGSSKFSPKKRWGFFPSASLGWRISEEPWFKNISALSFINQLKLRASYGSLGSDDDMNYEWMSGYVYQGGQVATNGYYTGYAPGYIFGGDWVYGANPQPLANLDATWQTITTFDVGVDFSAWNGLLGASFDYFLRKRTGLFASSSTELPTVVGATAPVRNANSDEHFGLELELTHRNKVGEFEYELKGIATVTRQKYLTYVQQSTYGNRYDNWRNNNMQNRYQGVQFGYEGAGRYTSWEDIWTYPIYKDNNILPGDYKYKDWNGDGQIDGNDTHPFAYDQTPWLNYSLDFRCSWRSIDFSMLFQGTALGSLQYEEPLYSIWGQSNGGGTLVQYLDRWRPANGSYDIYDPSLEWKSGYYGYTGHYPEGNSTFNRVSTAFLRLKSVEIGYTLPHFKSPEFKDLNLRVYFNAYNPLTITKVKFVDPEHPGDDLGRMYPLNKTYTLGLNLSF